ncbi:MAG: NADPH-dependent glutamate synthase [Spirochaetota bacterium]|nr:NADPH-dependent glutamate synthase [Spirochaetota bacterium]
MSENQEEVKKKKERLPRQAMPEQKPDERKKNFEEVPYGYKPDQAKKEASRCLQCKKPKCVEGCPVNIDIPAFIKLIEEEKFTEAARKIKEENALPAICGRVCPQEEQCEIRCILGAKGKDKPVAIGNLERFASDWEREYDEVKIPKIQPSTGRRIAVVGSGPAGLTVAGELRKFGHDVMVYEALHKSGGVLVYGIPEFRLPKSIVEAEVNYLKEMGVEVKNNFIVGRTKTIDELLSTDYDAVFVGSGAGAPMFLGIPGENLNGVFSANEYLTRSNLMKAYQFPKYDTPIIRGKKVATIGGGNVAMDSARTALRMGALSSNIIYRRSREELPARDAEIHHAEEEGIIFDFLTLPTRIMGDERGFVKSMECLRMELGEPDDSGRRRPVPIEGSEFTIDVDTVIIAIGNKPNPLIPSTTTDIEITKKGTIVVDEETGLTSKPKVYAGGDVVTGAATVILAMGAGKIAAKAIDEVLKSS